MLTPAILTARNLSDLVEALRQTRALSPEDQDAIDWSELPTFGGEEPADTQGVWSWDEDSVLIGSCADDLKVVDRSESPPKRPGRKPLAEGAGKTARVELRVRPAVKAAWEQRAAEAGLSLQGWVERALGPQGRLKR